MTTPDWIAVDWGTSRLRVWAMRGAQMIEARTSEQGMGRLSPERFEPALKSLIADWLPASGRIPVLACGMVGARGGWVEAAYRPVPCLPLDPRQAIRPPVTDTRLDLRILPGLSQADPPDVMRGEETQIAGFLALNPGFQGVLCLPGTHSKWVAIAGGEVVRFATFMTGELFALLAGQSVLRLTLLDAEPDPTAFAKAGAVALTDPAAVPAGLFSLRAGALLHGLGPQQAAGRLSGLLIGAELAAARPFWEETELVLIGTPGLTALYETLLLANGARLQRQDGGMLVLSGLGAARRLLDKDP
jgi:2-dehydro-3-deoxygalactonokinase